MKKFSIKTVMLALVLCFTVGLGINGSLAYFTDYTSAAGGKAISLTAQAEINENIDQDGVKHIVIKNTSDNDEYIRIKIYGADDDKVELGTNWSSNEDGYYYYSEVLAADGETTEITASADLTSRTKDFEIVVVSESSLAYLDNNGNGPEYTGWNLTKGAE